MIYNPDTKTILDDPNLLSDYLYEGLIGGTLGVLGNSVNVNTGTEVDTDIEAETGQSKKSTLPVLETMEQSELDWDAWEMFSLDEDGAEINADSMTESSTDTDSAELDDFDPWELFSMDEDAETSNSDYVTDSRTTNEKSRHADLLEKSFLSGLQGDTESDIILDEETIETADADAKPSAEQDIQNEFTVRFPEERGIMRLEQQLQEAFDQAVQERLAKEGAELLDKGGMPSEEQLQAKLLHEDSKSVCGCPQRTIPSLAAMWKR